MTPDVLLKYGWRKIASDAHALQLLRRELKHHEAWQQRTPGREWNYNNLLAIQTGNWYHFMKNPRNGHCSIIIWRSSRVKEARSDEQLS